ncbi:MAG: hypothetical protein H6Q65_760 [Firmicutes bacterium]|nr:hypothetical protein [Bacillota bacterium]
MKKNNKYKAAVTLGLVTAGYFVCYPFQSTFAGALLTGMFGAAMIGGLADWFAVSALFRRPLGISFRTAVIPRNRERIFASIIDMVQNQLLTTENIGRTLDRFDVADLLLRYWDEHGGRKDIQAILARIADDLLQDLDTERLAHVLDQLIRRGARQIEAAPLVAEALEWTIRNGYDKQLAKLILAELGNLVKKEQFRRILANLFVQARAVYERDLLRRRLANRLMEYLLDLSADRMAALAQDKIVVLLDDYESSRLVQERLHSWIQAVLHRLAADPAFRQRMEDWKNEQVGKRLHLAEPIAGLIDRVKILGGDRLAEAGSWRLLLVQQSDQAMLRLTADEEQRAKISRFAKNAFLDFVVVHHEEIGVIVRERLEQFTDKALADFIENRVGNDLQMIRINGSVVGGLVGMILFLLSYLAGSI